MNFSQDDVAEYFDCLKSKVDTTAKSKRSSISSYELGKTMPPFDLIFEFAQKTKSTLDDIFSKLIEWENGKAKSIDLLQETPEAIPYIKEGMPRDWGEMMEAFMEISKVAAMVPKLWERLERLEALQQKDGHG